MEIIPLDERTPDVEVEFKFNEIKTRSVTSGYRPHHEIISGSLTTGVHNYYGVDSVNPGETATGTITFILPEEYPNSLYIGQKINICEGARIVGVARVIKILNPIMQKHIP